jgi:light-regulated signal transduction histidine kinase (bacteriophytochrome)
VELTAMRKGGEVLPVEISVVRLGDAEPPVFAGFVRDLSDIKRAEHALVARAEQLARSNEELEQFAYVASHDLQEPLRMIASYVGLLEKRYRGQLDERADKYIHYAVDGAKRMQQLIDDVLTYSRVASRGMELRPVDLGPVVRDVLTILSAQIEETSAQVEVGPLPTVAGDASQLRQLFQNLLGNALKFVGDEPPRVSIDAHPEDGAWVVRVQDNGIGIEPQYFDRIFGVFQRLHERERYAGSGIGLAIAKKILDRHRGRIWLESGVGSGTTFMIRLLGVPSDGS